MNQPHMVLFRCDKCECDGMDMLHTCPRELTAEIHYIEELVTILRENACLRFVRGTPIHSSTTG